MLGALGIGQGLVQVTRATLGDKECQVIQGHAVFRVELNGLLVSFPRFRLAVRILQRQRKFADYQGIAWQRLPGLVEHGYGAIQVALAPQRDAQPEINVAARFGILRQLVEHSLKLGDRQLEIPGAHREVA